MNCYKPGYIISAEGTISRNKNGVTDLHPDLFVLLSTSGSTGSSKLVRLSATNLTSNAKAIAEVLDIQTPEVGCDHLPLHYSYGLSVLTSHLVCGAPFFLTSHGFIDAEFWKLVRKSKIARLPGVPFHFQMLARLRFERINLPSLRVLTQAGGSLDAKLRKMAHEYMDSIGGRFHVMNGQTETSPRITTMSHEDFSTARILLVRLWPEVRSKYSILMVLQYQQISKAKSFIQAQM